MICSPTTPSSDTTPEIDPTLTGTTDDHNKHCTSDIEHCMSEIREYLKSPHVASHTSLFNKLIRNNLVHAVGILKTIHMQLWVYMRSSLLSIHKIDYGRSIDSQYPYAVPYSGTNKPLNNWQFKCVWEMINKTILMYLFEGVTQEQLVDLILKLKNYSELERLRLEYGESIEKRLEDIFGVNILTTDLSDCIQFVLASFNRRSEMKSSIHRHLAVTTLMKYVRESILASFESTEREIHSDMQTLGKMFKAVKGNGLDKYTTELILPEIFEDGKLIYEDNGKLLSVFINRAPMIIQIDNLNIDVDSPKKFIMKIEEFIKKHMGSPEWLYQVIIDAASIFKDFTNNNVAYVIFNTAKTMRKNIHGVIFIDEYTDEILYMDDTRTINVTMDLQNRDGIDVFDVTGYHDNVMVYIDNKHLYNKKFIYRDGTHAVVTVSDRTTMRDIIESLKSMDKYTTSQVITLAACGKDYINSLHELNKRKNKHGDVHLTILAHSQSVQYNNDAIISRMAASRKVQSIGKQFVIDLLMTKLMNCLDNLVMPCVMSVVQEVFHTTTTIRDQHSDTPQPLLASNNPITSLFVRNLSTCCDVSILGSSAKDIVNEMIINVTQTMKNLVKNYLSSAMTNNSLLDNMNKSLNELQFIQKHVKEFEEFLGTIDETDSVFVLREFVDNRDILPFKGDYAINNNNYVNDKSQPIVAGGVSFSEFWHSGNVLMSSNFLSGERNDLKWYDKIVRFLTLY
eukprot:GHVR01080774.1.p1 GENE.GHVR01080774.1~~GHVR01080774.1.p1  ORF type:complete len:736 (+),score=142.28 GHVR01080774.1:330-2537(+)